MNPRLGVDLGATWMRLCLAGPDGRILKKKRLPAVPWRALAKTLRGLKLGRLARICVGSTRVWKASERLELARSLRGLAPRVRALSDVELAHRAAFGGKPGILVVGGTGSIAFGLDSRGRRARAGGLGPWFGDDGSAFWIGREALRDPKLRRHFPPAFKLKLAHSKDPVRATAAIAGKVLRLAQTGRAAARIRDEAAHHLADLAIELEDALYFRGPIPISWHGSLFENIRLLNRFLRRLNRKKFSPAPPLMTPETAAARLSP